MHRLCWAFPVVVLAACSGAPVWPDGGAFDAGVEDAGAPDAGADDAGAPDAGGSSDAGPRDAGSPDAGPCPQDAALVAFDGGAVCVDLYEAALRRREPDGGVSVWPYSAVVDGQPAATLFAVPAAGEKPQGYVSQVQAAAACAQAGKRLCTLPEWLAACRGPQNLTWPYGNTHVTGRCNDTRATHPVIELFGSGATFSSTEMNDPRLLQLANTVAPGGSFTACVSAWGAFDLHGNLHEWVDATTGTGNGEFKGGFFVDAQLNGQGCLYTTTAHAKTYHDYSTGFRCCTDPR